MGYSLVVDHRRMLFDAERNAAYARAMAARIGPDSVVLDLGAGLGLHGLLAAAAGAARVYLVEPEPVVNAASEAAVASGLGAKVKVLRGRIEDVALPERVDVIVSALTGNLLFSEDLLPALYAARDRYLKPGGAVVPARAQLWAAPCTAAALHREHVAQWQAPVMGIDYTFAARCAANSIIWPTREEQAGIIPLSAGACLADLDLAAASATDCDARASMHAEVAGECHALLAWIRLQVGDTWLSAHPRATPIHWSPALLPIDSPLPLGRGERVELELKRPLGGEWTWRVRAPGGERQHSTFLARADSAADLARAAAAATPGLGREGAVALAVLEALDRGDSIAAITQHVAQRFAMAEQAAERAVRRLASRYGAGP